MGKPRLGPDGLPIGWNNRSHDYVELFDLDAETALNHDGVVDKLVPQKWLDIPSDEFMRFIWWRRAQSAPGAGYGEDEYRAYNEAYLKDIPHEKRRNRLVGTKTTNKE